MRGQLRIIGGKWRRRLIEFDSNSGIRPTTDALRETLFNWLAPNIEGASCLDLFGGSGALGFEAASRGAQSVVFVDHKPHVIRQLKTNADQLQGHALEFVYSDAMRYLYSCDRRFDVVFLDPPFSQNLLQQAVNRLVSGHCLNLDARIYVEYETSGASLQVPDAWEVMREKRAKRRAHLLYRVFE